MPKIYQRAVARRDLVDHFVYLAENAGLATAERFLTNVGASFDELAGHPMIGVGADVTASRAGGPPQMARQRLRKLSHLLPAPCGRRVDRPRAICSAGLVEPIGDRSLEVLPVKGHPPRLTWLRKRIALHVQSGGVLWPSRRDVVTRQPTRGPERKTTKYSWFLAP